MKLAFATWSVLASIALASGAALADGDSCDSAIRVEGPAGAVSELRRALGQSSLRGWVEVTCAKAVVSLREREGGYSVALVIGEARVERDVATIAAAAAWVEAWMSGSSREPRGPAATPPPESAPHDVVATSNEPGRAASPEPRVVFVEPSAQVTLLGTGMLGTDASLWAGLELAARLHRTSSVWMGAALGVGADSTSTGPAEDAGGTSRTAIRASARAGARLPLSRSVGALLGGGLGVTWGTAVRELAIDDEDITQGGIFLEAHADASLRLSQRLSLLGGIAGRARLLSARDDEDDLERLVPDAMPALTGEVRLGAGWDFGAAP